MEYAIPNVPLKCLQAILRELVLAREPEIDFVAQVDDLPKENPKPAVGR